MEEEEKTIEQQLEEAIQLADEYKKKCEELVHKCNQYERIMDDYYRYTEMLINYFDYAVNGIRSPIKEDYIRAHYKEEDFSKSGEVPVYYYRNEIIRHISSFFGLINNDPKRIYKKIRKLLEKYYKKYTY